MGLFIAQEFSFYVFLHISGSRIYLFLKLSEKKGEPRWRGPSGFGGRKRRCRQSSGFMGEKGFHPFAV
jgi:hypothetical protein